MKDPTEKLMSFSLDQMIDLKTNNTNLWCPVLKFGRKKANSRRLPIVFKSAVGASKFYSEMESWKGKTIDEIRPLAKALIDHYYSKTTLNKYLRIDNTKTLEP